MYRRRQRRSVRRRRAPVHRRGRRGPVGFAGPRVSCRILKRQMSTAHGRRGRGKVLGMMAKAHCFRRGGGRRRVSRPGY